MTQAKQFLQTVRLLAYSRKADRIREKLGWGAEILNPNGFKPKGMHWKTFHQLKINHDVLVNQSLAGIMNRLMLFEDEPLL